MSPLQSRVDPFGELIASRVRGTMMGNRGGRIHRDDRTLSRRRFVSKQWICCVLSFNDRQREVWGPRSYTELFFLDEPTALAAGHRPCFECRRRDAKTFAVLFSDGKRRARADAMDNVLHAERLDGVQKRLHRMAIDTLPDGTFIVSDKKAFAVRGKRLLRWTPSGYGDSRPRPRSGTVDVLTPPSILKVLSRGYVPQWHRSAEG
jgi:hypothetical protein